MLETWAVKRQKLESFLGQLLILFRFTETVLVKTFVIKNTQMSIYKSSLGSSLKLKSHTRDK